MFFKQNLKLMYPNLNMEVIAFNTGKLGSQHRNENTGIAGAEVFEGQDFMTEEELMPFLVEEKDIYERVIQKGLK